jgi:hypothetical protein
MSFGLSIEKRPTLVIEPHQTRSWGWRWSCAKCGKANTRIHDEATASEEAHAHTCTTLDEGRHAPTISTAPHLSVWSDLQWGEVRRIVHY